MSTTPPRSQTFTMWTYLGLACVTTWSLASPAAVAWTRHETPSPAAVACAGLSAFGPLFATAIVGLLRRDARGAFSRWRTHPAWLVVALATPFALHMVATAVTALLGWSPSAWTHPPRTPEAIAALVVFPIGEEFGWRGFLHPRAVAAFGPVRGALVVGLAWGLWHLAYYVTPSSAGFDAVGFAECVVELPLYSLVIAWLFERSGRSMAVAIAVHAGAHLDHLEVAPRQEAALHVVHLVVVAAAAVAAARSLQRYPARSDAASGLSQPSS